MARGSRANRRGAGGVKAWARDCIPSSFVPTASDQQIEDRGSSRALSLWKLKKKGEWRQPGKSAKNKNHGTQDSRVVPHRGTNWAALRLTAQIGRDAVLSESYGRGYLVIKEIVYIPLLSVVGHRNRHALL